MEINADQKQVQPVQNVTDLSALLQSMPPGTAPETSSEAAETTQEQKQESPAEASDAQSSTESTPSNQAFAQMRVENTRLARQATEQAQQMQQLQSALQEVLKMSGIDPAFASNPQDVISIANEARIEAKAKEENIPVEVLKRLETLEHSDRLRLTQMQQAQAIAAYQHIQQKYNLTPEELTEFGGMLQAQGKDPLLLEPSALEREYVFLNLPRILEAARKEGAVQSKSLKEDAEQYSNTPPTTASGNIDPVERKKITTQSELDFFFHQNFPGK